MALSQPARFGEDWSDERIKAYLEHQAPEGINPDFHVLMHAYKHMRACDFERFLPYFLEAGRDLQARGPEGKTLLELAREHRRSDEFVKILEAAQAS